MCKNKKKSGLKLYQYSLLIIGVLGILFGPYIFTQPYPFGWSCLDFSQTGSIGDTIGGITAPFIGLVSILLLWWTLKEQLKFNKRQEKFNDSSSVLSIESKIFRLDEDIKFGYSDLKGMLKGYSISDLKRLYDGTIKDVGISSSEIERTINRVHIIEKYASGLCLFLYDSNLDDNEKMPAYVLAEQYLSSICDFYKQVASSSVKIIPSVPDLHAESVDIKSQVLTIKEQCAEYSESLEPILKKCKERLAEIENSY